MTPVLSAAPTPPDGGPAAESGGRDELAANPQAAAAAARIQAEQGFDPLDENTLYQAVHGYRKSMRRLWLWSMISVWPLVLVTVMIMASIPGQGAGPGALVLAAVGAIVAAFPLRKCVRAVRDLRQVMRVIRAYQNVLRATQPTAWRGAAVVRRWRHSQWLD
jgi:hypothetical protein